MKHLILAIIIFFSFSAQAATLFCRITPNKVLVGKIGDKAVYTYTCDDKKCFNLGVVSDGPAYAKAKQFYSMALAATTSGATLTVTYFNSSASTCAQVPDTELAFALGYAR